MHIWLQVQLFHMNAIIGDRCNCWPTPSMVAFMNYHTHGSHDLPYWLNCNSYFAHCLQMWCTLPPNVQNCVAAGLMTPLSSLLGARSSLGLSSRLGSCAPSGHHGPMSMHGCLMQWLMTPHIGSKWLSLSQAKWIFPHGPAIG